METIEIIKLIVQAAIAIGVIVAMIKLQHQKRVSQLAFFAEYTKRLHKLMLHFPENWDETSTLNDEQKRYLRVYFDLCCEQWFLYENEHIKSEFWEEWKQGMEFTFKQKTVSDYWEKRKLFYPDFRKFVETELLNSK